MNKRKSGFKRFQDGFMTPTLLAMITVFTILMIGVLELINLNVSTVANNITSQKAFNIAEAGINYYLWHIAHNPTDYKDGGTTPATPDATLGYGPYVHAYTDDGGKTQGSYTLWIKPQGTGSTIVTIRSIGKVNGSPITRTIDAKVGSPSFASYGLVSDTALWFGNTESANGPVHSNVGIRMDGASNSDVTSTNTTYVPPGNLGGDGSSKNGVWCHTSVTTPVNCSTRNKTNWQYPVANVDFNLVTSSLCTLKKTAFSSDASTASLASGANPCGQTPTTRTAGYLPQRATNGSYSLTQGYLIELNIDGTYNLSRVNGETDTASSYSTALTTVSVANNIVIPSSGVIFVEDNVWVRSNPTFNGRVTIGAGRLATTNNSVITIVDDLLYSTKNGEDAIGLISEDDILIAPYAPPQTGNFTFEIDAATLAQSGSVTWPSNYRSGSATCTRGWVNPGQTFTYYGSVASRQTWTWLWQRGGSCGNAVASGSYYYSGVLNNATQYDYNLLYAPPPSYPITGTYNVLSWHEVITAP